MVFNKIKVLSNYRDHKYQVIQVFVKDNNSQVGLVLNHSLDHLHLVDYVQLLNENILNLLFINLLQMNSRIQSTPTDILSKLEKIINKLENESKSQGG